MTRIITPHILRTILALSLLACGGTEPPDPPDPPGTTGTISGRVSLPPGAGGSTDNTRVAVYASYSDWENDRVLRPSSAGSNGNYQITELPPGTYYLDAWKDNNNNRLIDSGDFFGVYGSNTYPTYQPSPIPIVAGQTSSISFEMLILP